MSLKTTFLIVGAIAVFTAVVLLAAKAGPSGDHVISSKAKQKALSEHRRAKTASKRSTPKPTSPTTTRRVSASVPKAASTVGRSSIGDKSATTAKVRGFRPSGIGKAEVMSGAHSARNIAALRKEIRTLYDSGPQGRSDAADMAEKWLNDNPGKTPPYLARVVIKVACEDSQEAKARQYYERLPTRSRTNLKSFCSGFGINL